MLWNPPRCVSVFIPIPPFGSPVVFETFPDIVDDLIYVDDREVTLGSWLLDVKVADDPKFLVHAVEDCGFDEAFVGWLVPDAEPSEEVPDEEELNPT